MAIATTCPNCQALFRLPNELAGKKVKCQKCQGLFVVPRTDASTTSPGIQAGPAPKPREEPTSAAAPPALPLPPPPVLAPAPEPDRAEEYDEPTPRPKRSTESRRRPRREKASSGSGGMLALILVLVGVGVLSCFGCVVAGGIWFMSARNVGKKAEPIAIKDMPKIDGVKVDGIKDGKPPQVRPGDIAVNFGADGNFRHVSQLTVADPRTLDGILHKAYVVRMEANRTYQIDLMSNQFDAYLVLFNEAGLVVLEDDDSGGNLNSRIIFSPNRTEVFRIEASSLGGNSVGAYTLNIQRR